MSGVVAANLVNTQRHPVAPHIWTGIIGAEQKGSVGGSIRKAAHSYYCRKVGDYRHHSYLSQLGEIADIPLTTERDKTGRQIHKWCQWAYRM